VVVVEATSAGRRSTSSTQIRDGREADGEEKLDPSGRAQIQVAPGFLRADPGRLDLESRRSRRDGGGARSAVSRACPSFGSGWRVVASSGGGSTACLASGGGSRAGTTRSRDNDSDDVQI
jgi:hypothetical protein